MVPIGWRGTPRTGRRSSSWWFRPSATSHSMLLSENRNVSGVWYVCRASSRYRQKRYQKVSRLLTCGWLVISLQAPRFPSLHAPDDPCYTSPAPQRARAGLAQLVEQLFRKQQVCGSSPQVGSPLTGWRTPHADVAELADALRSGRSEGNLVGVRISPSAPDRSRSQHVDMRITRQ